MVCLESAEPFRNKSNEFVRIHNTLSVNALASPVAERSDFAAFGFICLANRSDPSRQWEYLESANEG